METRTSHGGLELPAIGLGTYNLRGGSGVDAVVSAISTGYQLIDTAFNYENEGVVGQALRSCGRRDGLILTSKLPGRHHDYDAALYTVEESCYRLGVETIDLYLIHWPNPNVGKYVEAWRGLIAAREAGLVRHIGVSNFLPEHILRLEKETGVVPEVNQIELHPYFAQEEALACHEEYGIITEAWSPLARAGELFDEPVIRELAQRYHRTPAQIVLAWSIARGVVPIPKASTIERQEENLHAAHIRLDEDDVRAITALSHPDGRLWGGDPATHEEF